jgi:hypothetical protein
LKLAIGRYKPLWERYINQSHPYYQDCVISWNLLLFYYWYLCDLRCS